MMIRKIGFIFCVLSVVTTAATARVHCRQDGVGGTKCVGYDSNGEYVSLRSRTNASGLTTTQGRIGNRSVNTRSRMGVDNAMRTTGSVDGQNVVLKSRTNVVGRTVTTGTVGNRSVHYNHPYRQ